jgi:hypothetical protein
VRPTPYEEVADLGAECDMVFNKLVSRTEELSQSDDIGRRQSQSLKAMAVGAEGIGEDKGVASVVLGSA